MSWTFRCLRLAAASLIALSLASCGGGGGGAAEPPQVVPPPPLPPPAEPPVAAVTGPGELRSATLATSIATGDIAQALAGGNSKIAGITPRWGVTAWRLSYVTTDGEGREILASGLVAVPEKPAGAVSPVISYQHGTIFKDAEAPSNALAPGEPTIVMASLGYIVVAPDYVGYGATKGTPHPYLLAAPTAAAVNDLITAARRWRSTQGPPGNGQLFLIGYSEGGYATVAAHRGLQATSSPHLQQLVASVAGGGPYHVGVTMDLLLNRVRDENRLLGALINPGFLRHLGESVRNEVRRALVRELLPGDTDVSFDTRIIDIFLADDIGTMDRVANVHDWAPGLPLRLYHGLQDRTVGHRSATVTLENLLARGASPAQVSLTDCTASPSDHLPCVPPFFTAAMGYLSTLARDL